MSLARFCEGCSKLHDSAIWYHRNKVDSFSHEWLCGLQYVLLPPQTMWSWRTFLYWDRRGSPSTGSSVPGSRKSADETHREGLHKP